MRLSPLCNILKGCAGALVLSAAASAQVSGTVVDFTTSNPIPDAWVTLQATNQRTQTAADGTFSLPGASGINLVIVAAKKGYYNASVTVDSPVVGVVIAAEAVPQSNDPGYFFVEPNTCGICHPNQVAQWETSNMSKAGTNLWTYDLYNGEGTPGGMGGFVYQRDSIHAGTNPNAECASCHQPERWIENNFVGLDDINNPSVAALHGVSCETCHKIAHIDPALKDFPGIWPGVVTHTRPAPADTQVQYGVLGDVSFELSSLMRPSYQPQLTSTMCAACHQDRVDVDQDGNFAEGEVMSEPTYFEWLATPYADPNSPLAATCVDCHMPAYGETAVCSLGGQPTRDPDQVRLHRFEGSTPQYLQNAVELEVDCSISGNVLTVDAAITNTSTGHHVPTGLSLRNMILLVEATRGGNDLQFTGTQTISAIGGVGDPAQGYYAGLPGKVYAKVFKDAFGNFPVWFTEAVGFEIDNRIPALATDATQYTFKVPRGSGGAVKVRARLIYRRADRATVDAKNWTVDGHGNPLADIQGPHFGVLMEEVTKTIFLRKPKQAVERP